MFGEARTTYPLSNTKSWPIITPTRSSLGGNLPLWGAEIWASDNKRSPGSPDLFWLVDTGSNFETQYQTSLPFPGQPWSTP